MVGPKNWQDHALDKLPNPRRIPLSRSITNSAQGTRLSSPTRMDGNPTEVAYRAIQGQFEQDDCPAIVEASRLDDGSIAARCNNGQTFGIADIGGKALAVRCSAAKEMAASGCPETSPSNAEERARPVSRDSATVLRLDRHRRSPNWI